jgi:hypothetical protein
MPLSFNGCCFGVLQGSAHLNEMRLFMIGNEMENFFYAHDAQAGVPACLTPILVGKTIKSGEVLGLICF